MRAKGKMVVRDAAMLARYMQAADCTQARLARQAHCTRQFVHMLVKGQVASCSPEIARGIENCLALLPGTLFVPSELSDGGDRVA